VTVDGALPTGSTRVAAVIGSPIRHSLSPTILNAAFQAAGLDWVYTAFEVAEGRAPEAVAAMRALGIAGLSVTMPHKADVIAALDDLSPAARALGAVNCIAWEGDRLVGHSTDGPGLVDALRIDEGFDPDGRRCVVIGAGGAALAAIAALADAGAASIVVVNRTADRAERAAALAGDRGRVGEVAEVADADLVVNGTPIGMHDVGAGPDLPFDPALLGPGQLVLDMVYSPLVTPTVQAARARGATAVNGLGMLVHQAAHAFRLWTGEDAPRAALSAAALAALTRPASED
jgi:shikimate dehydrogenase